MFLGPSYDSWGKDAIPGTGSTATVSGTSYTSCSAEWVSGCTWGSTDCIQPDHVPHVNESLGYGCPHQHTLLDLLLSSTHPHTPHPPTACGCTCSLCALLGTVVHLFHPLISLHDQSIRHGTHGGGLASHATMTTNTFGSVSWTSVGTYWGWNDSTPSTSFEHGSLTQSTQSQAHSH